MRLSFFSWKRMVLLSVVGLAVMGSGCMWGVVRDAETGSPIAGAVVTYTDSRGNTGTTTTDANGIYAFDQTKTNAPAVGWATIEIDAPGYDKQTESREVRYDDGINPTLSNIATFWELQAFALSGNTVLSYEGQPTLGPTDAPVRFFVFSDFQCPFCALAASDVLPQVQRDFGDKVLIVFRNYPLTGMHPYAYAAAEAGECAFEQGAFWQYHNALFAHQGALDPASLKSYAASLGLDQGQFNNCLDSGQTAGAVNADMSAFEAAARAAGATSFGTPSFFINGQFVSGAYPYDESSSRYQPGMLTFRQMIQDALAKATS